VLPRTFLFAMGDPLAGGVRRRAWILVGLLVLLLALAVAWSASPLREWLNPHRSIVWLRVAGGNWGPWLGAVAVFVCLVLAIPLSFLTVVTVVAYGAWTGGTITLAAGAVAAGATFYIGRALGLAAVERFAGPRLALVSQKLGERGLLAVIAIRLVPVAPFAIVNMVAGTLRIRLRDMVVGTFLGMLPGTIGMAYFVDQIVEAIARPGHNSIWLVIFVVALVAIGAFAFLRFLKNSTLP
jgi:uncharacterized membrane protein YdjX (TVP38/TMEM64 family)